MSYNILGIETSCDETSVAILKNQEILSHIVYSQREHARFGGVVPEIASRAHLQILQKIIPNALKKSKLGIEKIDLFSATCGPGLIGGLLVGSTVAKSLAIGLKKPFYPINHLEGHMVSPLFNNDMKFPNITLLLTGGHTQIYLVKSINNYVLLGETVDDAIGESFDKVGKLLGLNYPGGPHIEKLSKLGKKLMFDLPHPLQFDKKLNFSFSGIKTAVNLIVKKQKKIDSKFKQDLSASFENKIIEILSEKLIKTIKFCHNKKITIKDIVVVGGVASNNAIKNSLKKIANRNDCRFLYPLKDLCGDNAAMIALVCLLKHKSGIKPNINFIANPRLNL